MTGRPFLPFNLRSKLLLGSWTHGGRRSCSPYAGSFPCFEADLYLDAVRFFDCRLNGECWGGILEEPSVHYWQVSFMSPGS